MEVDVLTAVELIAHAVIVVDLIAALNLSLVQVAESKADFGSYYPEFCLVFLPLQEVSD